MTDRIIIHGLRLQCVIGILPAEQDRQQNLRLNLALHIDIQKAAASDNITDTIDYQFVCDTIASFVKAKRYLLLESMAESIAQMILSSFDVYAVELTIEKPEALKDADFAAVSIRRDRKI